MRLLLLTAVPSQPLTAAHVKRAQLHLPCAPHAAGPCAPATTNIKWHEKDRARLGMAVKWAMCACDHKRKIGHQCNNGGLEQGRDMFLKALVCVMCMQPATWKLLDKQMCTPQRFTHKDQLHAHCCERHFSDV